MQDNISNVNIAKRLEHTDMSNCLLNVVAQHLRFYYKQTCKETDM